MQIKPIFFWKDMHQASLWQGGSRQFGNGLWLKFCGLLNPKGAFNLGSIKRFSYEHHSLGHRTTYDTKKQDVYLQATAEARRELAIHSRMRKIVPKPNPFALKIEGSCIYRYIRQRNEEMRYYISLILLRVFICFLISFYFPVYKPFFYSYY